MTGDLTGHSRFLSYVLRHNPGAVGIELDAGGWVDVDTLLTALAAHGHPVPVELGLVPASPPDVLYHGTVARFLPAIRTGGLVPGQRHHVHLSVDEPTAATVGARRGTPVVLRVDAAGMHRAGHEFFLTDNGVWLTAAVPPQWIHEPGRH